jgi:putative transposase
MGTGGYKITDLGAMYFVSFAVVGWINVFTRKDYRDVVIENI